MVPGGRTEGPVGERAIEDDEDSSTGQWRLSVGLTSAGVVLTYDTDGAETRVPPLPLVTLRSGPSLVVQAVIFSFRNTSSSHPGRPVN